MGFENFALWVVPVGDHELSIFLVSLHVHIINTKRTCFNALCSATFPLFDEVFYGGQLI
jgi:hypothetical protein